MKIGITKFEAKLIKNWFSYEWQGHFGDGAVFIGEEESIIEKIKDFKDKDIIYPDFNLTELEILKNWAEHGHGIYEETKLKEKIEKVYKLALAQFRKEIKS